MLVKLIVVAVLYLVPVAKAAIPCTYPNLNIFLDPTALAGYYKQFIINSPVTSYDSVNNDFASIDASESIRIGENSIATQNDTVDYASLYKTTNQLEVITQSSSVLRQIETSIKYTVSACLGGLISNPCRWTAPVVCAKTTDTSIFFTTASYIPFANENLICAPVLMEWKNFNDYYSNTTAEIATNAFHAASNINWTQKIINGSLLATPVTDMPSAYLTKNTLQGAGPNGKTGQLKYKMFFQQCPFGSKPWVYLIRDQQNLAQGGVSCVATKEGTGVALQGLAAWPPSPPCTNLTVAVTLTPGEVPSAGVVMAYPPTTQFNPANEFTQWRQIQGMYPSNPAQDPILNPNVGAPVQLIMVFVGLCSNFCAAKTTVLPLEDCDLLCYAVLDQLIITTNLTMPFSTAQCVNLQYAMYPFGVTPSTEDISRACALLTDYFNQNPLIFPEVNPLTQPESSSQAPLVLYQILEIQTTPTNYAFGGNTEYQRCKEVLTADNETIQADYPSWAATFSNGEYTSAVCGVTNVLLNSTGKQAGSTIMQQLFDRDVQLPVNVMPSILTNSDLVTNWLQALQTIVLSVLASTGILAAGSQSGRVDSMFYVAMNVTTCCKASSYNKYKRPAVWLLNISLLVVLIITNAAAYINVVQLTLQYSNTNRYVSTNIETVTLEGNSFIVESVHIINYHPKVWPGIAMLACYSVIIVFMFAWQLWNMFHIQWEQRWMWLSDQSWESWRKAQRDQLE